MPSRAQNLRTAIPLAACRRINFRQYRSWTASRGLPIFAPPVPLCDNRKPHAPKLSHPARRAGCNGHDAVTGNVEIGGGDFGTGGTLTLNINAAEFKVNNNANLGSLNFFSTTNINLTNGASWNQNAAGLNPSDGGGSPSTTNIFIDGTSQIVRNVGTNLNAEFHLSNSQKLFVTMASGSLFAFGDMYLRQAEAQVSVLQGAGNVVLTRTGADQFRNTGRIEAIGNVLNIDYGYTSMGANAALSETMAGGIITGYYATGGGTLRMPDVILGGNVRSWGNRHDVAADTIPLINSLQFTGAGMSGTIDIEILALNLISVQPGLINPVGVWNMSEIGTIGGVTGLTIHYDDFLAASLAVSEANLKMLFNDGSGWVNITSSINTGTDLIKGTPTSFIGQFAVAENFQNPVVPEPSTYALGLIGLAGFGLLVWRRRRNRK